MPRIARIASSATHTALMQESLSRGESKDCSVRAVAAAAAVSYDRAHAACADAGREERCGVSRQTVLAAMRDLGFDLVLRSPQDFISRYPGSHATALRSVTTHHPDRFPAVWADGKVYLMFTAGHVLCIRDGVNCDWTRGRAMRARKIYEVRQK